jgi:amino acid transporter
MFLLPTFALSYALSSVRPEGLWSILLVFQHSDTHWDAESIFNILIALVFGFSTLNILGLVTRRFENRPNRLNAGEILALTAMALSVCFLGWEMLHIFHVFPIKLER